MSQDIIKSIAINLKDKTVFVTSAESNVIPIEYTRSESISLSNILKEKGVCELNNVILYEYWLGVFAARGYPNRFSQSADALRRDMVNHQTELTKEEIISLLSEKYVSYTREKFGEFIILTEYGYLRGLRKDGFISTHYYKCAKVFKKKTDALNIMFNKNIIGTVKSLKEIVEGVY